MERIPPSKGTQKSMRANRATGTKPEMALRRLVHALGYRYRLHRKDLPGKPDLVFAGRRKIMFVHGCFWHQHGCKRSSITPKNNADFWRTKLQRNVQRDCETVKRLTEAGWTIQIIWECELKNIEDLKNKIVQFLDAD